MSSVVGLIFNENFAEKNMFMSPVNSAGDPLTHTTVAMCKRQMQTYMGKCNIQTFTLYLSAITYNTSLYQCGILVCLYKNTNSSLYRY